MSEVFFDPATLVPALNPLLVVDGAGLEKVRSYFARVTEFAKDFETNITPRFFHRKARTLQVGDKNEQYVIDLLAFAETPEALAAEQGNWGRNIKKLRPVIDVIGPVFQSNSHLKLVHNGEFEYMVSKWNLGLRPWHFYDTKLAEHVLWNGKVRWDMADFWGMDDVILRRFGVRISKEHQKSFDLETPLTDGQFIYCACDCRFLFAIRERQMREIVEARLEEALQIENDWLPAVGDRQLNGMYLAPEPWIAVREGKKRELVDVIAKMDEIYIPIVGRKVAPPDPAEAAAARVAWKALEEKTPEEVAIGEQIRSIRKDPELKEKLKAQRAALEAERNARKDAAKTLCKALEGRLTKKALEAYEKCEGEALINYNAHEQVRRALFKGSEMGMFRINERDKHGFTEKNLPSTNDKKLEKYAHVPVIALLRDYRSLAKLIDSYGEKWITHRDVEIKKGEFGYVDPDTGRIHPHINQIGAETSRESCTSPNLYNLPRDDDYRSCFYAAPGHKMVCQDCSGQELRIAADYSGETEWINAFNNDQDVHSISVHKMYKEMWEQAAILVPTLIDGKEIPPCAYFTKDKKKCKCPIHAKERNNKKPINFGVPYGKTKWSLAVDMKCTPDEAGDALARHRAWVPTLWAWIDAQGEAGFQSGDKQWAEVRTCSGFRRYLKKPNSSWAYNLAKEKLAERMKEDPIFREREEAWAKAHKTTVRVEPTTEEVQRAWHSLAASVRRDSVNTPIQGSGAHLMKLAAGCGFDENGKPYLWHLMEPNFAAKFVNFVYDEFEHEVPFTTEGVDVSPFYNGASPIDKDNPKRAFDAVRDGIIRAGAHFFKKVKMESEGSYTGTEWKK